MIPTADTEYNVTQVTSLNRNSSPSRDVRDSCKNTQVAKQSNNRELTLNMLIKEIIFCIVLALTTYAALHNTPWKISKHPQAVRFFGPHSVVTDWYQGQLSNALAAINDADVAFVMYYAPWDAESQYVRGEFEKAAEILSDRVLFAAINCWNPGSECRLQHHKIPSWPILMTYTINSRGILYKGPRNAHSMVRFLELIMRPLERVSSTEDLVNLLSTCDAVAVGYTSVATTSKYYNIWYNVALKSREFDVMGELCFAAVTSEGLAMDLGVDTVPSARLMLWNDTKEYKMKDNNLALWNESHLLNWVLNNFVQPIARIIPMWKKANSFEKYVDGSPLLILFTPLNPLYEVLPAYALMREVAMEFYNCKNSESSEWISELMKLQQVQRLLYQRKDFVKFCKEYKFKKPARIPSTYYKKEIVSHNNKYPWRNTTYKRQKEGMFNFLVKRGQAIADAIKISDDSCLMSSLGLSRDCIATVLPAEKSFYKVYEQCQSYDADDKSQSEPELDSYERNAKTSMLPFEDDPLSSENLIQDNVKHFCKLVGFAGEWGPAVVPEHVNDSAVSHIRGLACSKNNSLNIIAVDSVRNHHFAESLGIDILSKKDMTAVVILDSRHESQYVLSQEYSAQSVREFIYNFTRETLKRSLRTRVEDAAHTHHFGSGGHTEQMGINESTIHVLDLTTRTFRRAVKTSGTVTIVAVCGGSCSAHTTRALVSAARLLAACGVSTRAARLDALRHDLPWHYTVTIYPTVLVFFATRDGEPDSRSYPPQVRVSASGLVALALRSLGAPQHLRVRLALCARSRSNIEKKTCLKELKEHVTTVIGRTLQYWRQTDDKQLKDAFLRRLHYLHRVSLDLSLLHTTDLRANSKKQMSLLNSLSTLSKNWNIDVSMFSSNLTVSATVRS